MARLSSSFRSKNRTTRQFREQYANLPTTIQEMVRAIVPLFHANPDHPSLRNTYCMTVLVSIFLEHFPFQSPAPIERSTSSKMG